MFIDLRERGIGEREKIKHQLVASIQAPTGDPTNNLDICPEQKSNLHPFGV